MGLRRCEIARRGSYEVDLNTYRKRAGDYLSPLSEIADRVKMVSEAAPDSAMGEDAQAAVERLPLVGDVLTRYAFAVPLLTVPVVLEPGQEAMVECLWEGQLPSEGDFRVESFPACEDDEEARVSVLAGIACGAERSMKLCLINEHSLDVQVGPADPVAVALALPDGWSMIRRAEFEDAPRTYTTSGGRLVPVQRAPTENTDLIEEPVMAPGLISASDLPLCLRLCH